LISVDELRAAGALDVPPAWRKSLGGERTERHLFSGTSDDDGDENTRLDEQDPTARDPDDDVSAD
jgi:hypothetical protein